jgi:hypothetical protein
MLARAGSRLLKPCASEPTLVLVAMLPLRETCQAASVRSGYRSRTGSGLVEFRYPSVIRFCSHRFLAQQPDAPASYRCGGPACRYGYIIAESRRMPSNPE